jgi:hypothetical protein
MRANAFRSQLEKAGWKIGGNLQIDFQRAPGSPFSEKKLIVLRARTGCAWGERTLKSQS